MTAKNPSLADELQLLRVEIRKLCKAELQAEILRLEAQALAHFADEPTIVITIPIPRSVTTDGVLVAVMGMFGDLVALSEHAGDEASTRTDGEARNPS